MRLPFAAMPVLLLGNTALAQDTFTFEAVNGFVYVELAQEGEDVRVEYLTAVDADTIMCIILDDDGQPVAIQRDIANDGQFDFYDAALPEKDRILCQAQE